MRFTAIPPENNIQFIIAYRAVYCKKKNALAKRLKYGKILLQFAGLDALQFPVVSSQWSVVSIC
jgi:hypothetical protein